MKKGQQRGTAGSTAPAAELGRAHRILIGVVVAGALVIAGIGFAGSYAAVRELALKKGFGNFAYVFPIGIDAGICVLLALDLLLTWIRIPFPLLRQTAWLLTVATIAFNGAAAWPDPLGVGMHAVIPVLFVVSVEAARHAIGRIADITADKHMEGVRLTRWLLSPVPTFLLWRRMKLWELRSYEQVIKLEQDRLVYQARLHSRFGRAWRRKAPVESLMPLRLARYGVPLAETAPSGLAAAGIEPAPLPPLAVEQGPATVQADALALEARTAGQGQQPEPVSTDAQRVMQAQPVGGGQPREQASFDDADGRFAEAYQLWRAQFQTEPTAAQFASFLRDEFGISTAAGGPLSDDQLLPLLRVFQQHYTSPAETHPAPGNTQPAAADESWDGFFYSAWLTYAHQYGQHPDSATLAAYLFQRDGITAADGQPLTGEDLEGFVTVFQEREFGDGESQGEETHHEAGKQAPPAPAPAETDTQQTPSIVGAQAAEEKQGLRVNAAITDEETAPAEANKESDLTTVDRYYLAWAEHQKQRGAEPTDKQLSAYLAEKGVKGRGGKPISPSTLRRYLLPFRTYSVWAEHRIRSETPLADAVAQDCATRGITAQYNNPLTATDITKQAHDFERRWKALARHRADAQS
ncbi:DUF2637 domain-containing protein [Streptomyces sp. WAC00263]|uniref:DUF2637 domain-containing protein n=1 Tax=Streptomyces sp. WAC00263 TaxID=1917422 RepID=UPI001F5138F9|nr:DUF2637 domain-containing protein [Streptomyces sp. WAC00263]